MNLISNSLKFTSNGGYVKVKGKIVNKKSELSCPEQQVFEEIVQNSK